jgi:hypothetical protein
MELFLLIDHGPASLHACLPWIFSSSTRPASLHCLLGKGEGAGCGRAPLGRRTWSGRLPRDRPPTQLQRGASTAGNEGASRWPPASRDGGCSSLLAQPVEGRRAAKHVTAHLIALLCLTSRTAHLPPRRQCSTPPPPRRQHMPATKSGI